MSNIILGDGAMGTELRARGVEVPSHIDSIWSALAVKKAPKEIEQIHLDYIEAGSDYITINNYTVTRPILSRENMEDELESLTIESIKLARQAISKSNNEEIKILGTLPPLETSYRADLILDEDEMNKQYSELVNILKNEVDIIICETMASALEAKCALKAALKANMPVWVSWTLHGDKEDTLPSGENINEAFKSLKGLDADAYLINCCAANLVGPSLKNLKELTDSPIGAYANAENINKEKVLSNAETAEERHWESTIKINEKSYLNEVKLWIEEGASIVAGCCRTRPSYIKELKNYLKN
tara:strand:+ start:5220 stop:6122 length:903 start_codon:yes stop_codon:yes gene_type:complete